MPDPHSSQHDSQSSQAANQSADEWDTRLRETVAKKTLDTSAKIQRLLRLGAERFGVDTAHLARIDPADGSYVITEVADPPPPVQQGGEASLSDTYCRTVLAKGTTQVIENAPAEGWTGDPAYEHSGMTCYLGTKVTVAGELYGTVSFSAEEPPPEPFDEADRSFAELIAQGIGRTIERTRRENGLLEARHRLQRTENLLQRIQEVADVGGWELGIQDWEVFWTEGACRMLGLPEGESAEIEALFKRIVSEHQGKVRTAITDAVENEDSFTVRVPLKEDVGTCQWIEVHGRPYTKDKLVTTVLGTVRDISEQRRRMRQVERARHESIRRLARAAEHRHCETGKHIRRVGILSKILAEALGQPPAWQNRIEEAAPLHDVGKIGIADEILLKQGYLTDKEYEEMKRHTLVGADLLSEGQHALIRMAERIARAHHEQWNGNGYPEGLHGEDIPLEARIVAVADAFDAMTHDRPYREALSPKKAFSVIEEEAREQFDPAVSAAALRRREKILSTV